MNGPSERRKYRILSLLGTGGFGRVYRARLETDDGFSKEVAVKILHEKARLASSVLKRFRDEARILGLVRDRAVVSVDPPTRLGGHWAIVMEFVEGASAQELLKHGPLPPGVAVEIVGEVARALDRLWHAKGPDGRPLQLLHRDLKPANLQITVQGDVKILDFGIARANFSRREARTMRGVAGTVGYVAPERMVGTESPAGDVFSLGVVLYLLVFGEPSEDEEEYTPPVPDDEARRLILELSNAMRAYAYDERPSAKEVERQCRAIRQKITGPWLSEWAAEAVPRCMDEREDDWAGNVLTESEVAVPLPVGEGRPASPTIAPMPASSPPLLEDGPMEPEEGGKADTTFAFDRSKPMPGFDDDSEDEIEPAADPPPREADVPAPPVDPGAQGADHSFEAEADEVLASEASAPAPPASPTPPARRATTTSSSGRSMFLLAGGAVTVLALLAAVVVVGVLVVWQWDGSGEAPPDGSAVAAADPPSTPAHRDPAPAELEPHPHDEGEVTTGADPVDREANPDVAQDARDPDARDQDADGLAAVDQEGVAAARLDPPDDTEPEAEVADGPLAPCGSPAALEDQASAGGLSGEAITCLDGRVRDRALSQTDRDKIGRVLLVHHQAVCGRTGACGDYETLQRYFFEQVDRSDPDMLFAWATWLFRNKPHDLEHGPETLLWISRTMERRDRWGSVTFVQRVGQLHEMQAVTASRVWDAAARSGSGEAERYRLLARQAAVDWLDFRLQLGQDGGDARRLCEAAADEAFCERRGAEAAESTVLTLVSVPLGATVFLNDDEVGRTPLTREVPRGSYRLRMHTDDGEGELVIAVGPGEPVRYIWRVAEDRWDRAY